MTVMSRLCLKKLRPKATQQFQSYWAYFTTYCLYSISLDENYKEYDFTTYSLYSISLDENYKEYAGVKEHGQVDITELEWIPRLNRGLSPMVCLRRGHRDALEGYFVSDR